MHERFQKCQEELRQWATTEGTPTHDSFSASINDVDIYYGIVGV